ncbi:MAG: family 16 glycoside hydrolase, partial [Armatimonadota bacterium]
MRWMIFAAAAVILTLWCTVAPAQEPLFQDNFADLSHWNAPSGWRVADGALTVAGGDIQLCRSGGDWRNYALEFDVTVRSVMAQWVIRAARPQDCCFIQLTSEQCPYAPSSLRYHTWRDGKLGTIKEDALPVPIKIGQTYHVRCEVVGTTTRLFLNGKAAGNWGFGEGYETGTVGFRGGGTEAAEYRNLKVLPCESLSPLVIARRARPRPVEHDAFLNPAFRAEWIWGPGDKLNRAFRQAFTLPGPALEAKLWITCDNAYQLFANGQRVGAGDAWQSPAVYDLTPFLKPGRNVLAVARR